MGTIADKLTYLNETKTKIKDNLNFGGANITNETFREYANKIKGLYVYFMNNGLDVVWNNWEKVIGSGTSITLNQTMEAPIKIDLKGNAEQNGTPTPTDPIEVETTTGNRIITICGKNQCLIERAMNNTSSPYINGGLNYYFEKNKNVIRVVGTATNYAGGIAFLVKGRFKAGTYTFGGFPNKNIGTYDRGTIYLWYDTTPNDSLSNADETLTNVYGEKTFTTTKDFTIAFRIISQGQTTTTTGLVYDETYKLQLEKGNQKTTYEDIKSNIYPINLGKNLMNLNNITSTTNVGITFTKQTDGSILINGTSTSSTDNWIVLSNISYKNLYGTPTINIGQVQQSIESSKQGDFTLSASITNGTLKGFSYNSNNDATACLIEAGASFDNAILKVQLEKGYLSDYVPYKTPIYLGEIGNYKDYIFRNTTENPLYDSNLEEGQWYIHKEINKVILNGSETWRRTYVSGSGSYAFWAKYAELDIPLGIYDTKICNRFEYQKESWSLSTPNHIAENTSYTSDLSILFNVDNTIATTIQEWNTWLSTHNTDVYYILDTPTNTLITDYELIYQLNELEKAKSYDNTTNILQSNDNLPFMLDVRALKKSND